jgi:type IV pilus assembly protein PilP
MNKRRIRKASCKEALSTALNKGYRCGMLVSLVMLVSACSTGDEYADIKAFIDNVKEQPVGGIPPLPEFESYQAFSYSAANRRSPFEPPVIVVQKSEEQKRNVGLKPPQDHVKQYLERFNLSALAMVGTLEQEGETWALIEDSDRSVHRVQVGDYMGSSWGQVESINDNRMDITEIVSDGAGGWLRRPRSIALRGLVE